MKSIWLISFLAYYFALTFVLGNEESFVVTTESSNGKEGGQENFGNDLVPKIYEMQIESNVSNRFAHTLITSKVRNWNSAAREATFSVILPEKAFISEFVMVIGGKSYEAYVKEKEEARNIYQKAISSGLGAAHVAVTARESNRFTVSVNVEALSKATFLLKYEELLKLKDNKYELVINIHPNQPVGDLFVNVMINESRPLKFVKVPSLRSGNEISKREGDLDPRASVFRLDSKSALVQFKPNVEKQKEFAGFLGTDASKGLSGQFVVQYDVERDPNGGEVLVKDGYFVHFFAPSEYKPLNKFIVFVLDTSGSMYGQKIAQLKQAMITILEQLDPNDYFQIVNFETNTKVWNIIDPKNSTETTRRSSWYRSYSEENSLGISNMAFPSAFSGHPDNIKKAKEVILGLNDGGGTNIYEALQIALQLIETEKTSGIHEYLPQPIIMFLTDGDPNVGISNTHQIVPDITRQNNKQAPIYSLSFGDYANKNFLKKLSQKNQGFSRHIYEASDAALQLEKFYKEIASPLLSGVKFKYVPDATSLTKTKFPLHFAGSEIVVAGKLDTSAFPIPPRIICTGRAGPITLQPTIERPITSLERLWAYLTIQQLLDEKEVARNKTANEKKALDLALKYSFVTPVSSLVVVKPNSTESNIDTEAADKISKRYETPGVPTFAHIPTTYSSSRGMIGVKGSAGPSSSFGESRLAYMPTSFPSYPVPSPGSSHSPSFRQSYQRSYFSPILPLAGEPSFPSRFDSGSYPTSHVWSKIHGNGSDKLVGLKTVLPWLENCLNENGTLKSPPGGYELGLNETITLKPICPETPTNTTGHCELLHACPQVHPLLPTEDIFVRYFCPLTKDQKRFAGVCCP